MHSVKSVIIVGGGSAGWLTALVLNTYCPFLKVKLIRPQENTPIGVGESTQTDFLRLLKAARLDVDAFYKACDASMKCGILYQDWNAIGEQYWHPFSNQALTASFTAAHYYQQMIQKNPDKYSHAKYYESVHSSYTTCVQNNRVAQEAAAALHVDARKITEYLEGILSSVEVIGANVSDVQTSNNRVENLILDDGSKVAADLYIDCTGFQRALFKQVVKPEVLPYEANVNKVVTAQLPYVDKLKEFTPYTRAHAHEHGWTWTIPLQSRLGSGYVYHGDFCSAEQAEINFRQYWGLERMRDIEVRHFAFDSSSLRNPWVENVVTIGLSAGFSEPLEATGLNWTITSAELLSQSIAAHYYDQDTSAKYNANMLGYIYDVQDFLDAHYKLSARRDSEFWIYQTSRTFPERLGLRLALYGEEMPNNSNRLKTSPWAFNEVSWLDILNAYHFKYKPLEINSAQISMAQKALYEINSNSHQGFDPASCLPPLAR